MSYKKYIDFAIIALAVGIAVVVCVRDYRRNKTEAGKTEKHIIREFFNHFGDMWNYKR